jgi:peptidoglycan-N-acetylglucosamine deacetylase
MGIRDYPRGGRGHRCRDAAMELRTRQELARRRAIARRKRRRRRIAALCAFAAVLLIALVAVALGTGGSSSHRRATTSAAASSAAPPSTSTAASHHAAAATPVRSAMPSIAHVLRYTSYVRRAGARRREVALTFDDGPSPYTGQIIRILRSSHTPATFFVIGRSAQLYPRLVAAEVRAGAEVGDHTETHAFLSALSASAQAAQIAQAADVIRAAGAPSPQLFRPPYGSFNSSTVGLLRSRRMLMVLWSADTKDYSRPGRTKIIYVAVSGAQPGAVILMHDGGGDRSQTVAALPRIITRLRQRQFRLVTVSQLVADDPPPVRQPPPRPLSGVG